MIKTFISPGKYYQGPGLMAKLGEYSKEFGKKALILISEGGQKRSGASVDASMKEAGVDYVFMTFNGECSKKEVNRVVDEIKANGCDMVIGIGGGKIFDTAKAAAFYTDTPVVVCPTIAATDAPCSALSVIYTEEGEVEEYLFLKNNPNMVIMDSAVIAKSPVRLTVSGMGDALATYFEARAVQQKGGPNFAGGTAGIMGQAVPKLCYETLQRYGYEAVVALNAGALSPAVEAIIEANTLFSGLGFESGGIAMSHAVHNGFCSLEECHHYYHGEKVSMGVLTQLVLEKAEELDDVLDFCISVGLPVTLEQIGITEPTWEKMMQVAKIACGPSDTGNNMPFEVTPEMVANAILAADAIGKVALGK